MEYTFNRLPENINTFWKKFHLMLGMLDYRIRANNKTTKYNHERHINFGTTTNLARMDRDMLLVEDGEMFEFASGRDQKLDLPYIESFIRKWLQSTMKLDVEIKYSGKKNETGARRLIIYGVQHP